MNHKNARITKLIQAGRSDEQIARTLGQPLTPELQLRLQDLRQTLAVKLLPQHKENWG